VTEVDRRSALVLGLAGTLLPVVAPDPAVAAAYGPNTGEELAPGVREVFLSEREAALAAYKRVWMTDLVFQPGAATAVDLVPNDRVCHMVEGLLRVRLGEQEVVLKKGHVWASPKGAAEGRSNTGASVAVVRVIDLLPW
jgi:quercetin dioxygenase-like cupin family protein